MDTKWVVIVENTWRSTARYANIVGPFDERDDACAFVARSPADVRMHVRPTISAGEMECKFKVDMFPEEGHTCQWCRDEED